MAKKWAKIFDYLINPVGTAISDIAIKLGASEDVANITTPFGGQWLSNTLQNFSKDTKAQKIRSEIEDAANKLGMSLEEYLSLHPDIAETYELADKGFIDKSISKIKKAADKVLENEHVQAGIENLTGERDTKENEKNRQFQHDEAEIARAWEQEQAQTAREWDSIGAQMERAASVGVNPVSIAMQNGGINGSLGTSIPSSPGIPAGSSGLMHSGLPDIASMVFNGIGTLAENRLKQSQADDITIMRKYNIAEKIANTDHLRELCTGVQLSNTAQTIQNSWLDVMNQATYDNMLLEQGVKRSTILEKRSITRLNVQQIGSVKQSMDLALKEFNAKLPLELQLMESELDFNRMSVQDLYSEISMRYLQSIEQENRNRQSFAEAGSAEVSELIARQTYEDAISAFHNDMVKGAAEAGISLNDYMYYGASHVSVGQLPGAILNYHHHRKNENVRGITDNNIRGLYP